MNELHIKQRPNDYDLASLVEEAIQKQISNSPQPLKDLGVFLGKLLDEDDFSRAEEYLIKATMASPSKLQGNWQNIESCPPHKLVMFYREDAGIFFGQYTYCAEWVTEQEQIAAEYNEETLWSMDCWAFDFNGANRCDGDLKPTHWMPLPESPHSGY